MKQPTDKVKRIRRAKRMRENLSVPTDPISNLGKENYATLVAQVEEEYQLAWKFMQPKIAEWLVRLKLYNNQKRDKDKVGSPDLYTMFQTVLASLYDDKLGVTFKGRLENDEDKAENLNMLAEYDHAEMLKDEHDYAWDWDALFFGRGLSLFTNFDTESKTPIPTVIDPTTFLRSPHAISVNGNRAGEGTMRYGGYEVRLTKAEMKGNSAYFNIGQLKRGEDLQSLIATTSRSRMAAQGLSDVFGFDNLTGSNAEYTILRWFTNWKGKKVLVELGNNRTQVVRLQEIPWDLWPVIDRTFSPISHDWDGVSIPDIIEDKQRFRSVLLNVAGDTEKANLNGMYLFHEDRFKKTQDFNFKFGKWIPVRGQGALQDAAQPLQTRQVGQGVKFIMEFLDLAAQKALATPDIQQGQQAKGDPTLGALEMQASRVDTRYSLTAKVFGWSERAFWKQWYRIYDHYFPGLGTKVARLEGAFGPKWRDISAKDITTQHPMGPEVEIESRTLSEAKKMRNYQAFSDYATKISADQTLIEKDSTYLWRKVGKLIMPKDEVERIIPLTIDEYQAKEENDLLNEGQTPPISIEQNHQVHLRVHAGAKDNEVTRAHIKAHIKMLMEKRLNPTVFPPTDEERMKLMENGGASATPPGSPGFTPPPEGAGTDAPIAI